MISRSLALALAVTTAIAGVALAVSIAMTRGELVLPLDDAYIHFAIARTLAEHHSYGLQPGAFSTPASSLLWPLLLAAGRLVSLPLEWAALALGLVGGAISLTVMDDVFAREELSLRARTVLLLVTGALVPLVPMALLGMEHSLHIAVTLALVSEATRRETRSRTRLALLAALAVSLRYESVFVVAALALWWIAHVRARSGMRVTVEAIGALAVGACAPIGLAAAFFVDHGAPSFPASVVLKRTHVTLGALPELVVRRFVEHPHVPALLLAALATWLLRASVARQAGRPWLFVGALSLLAHTTVAQLGWLYRYESHAVAVTLVGVALALWPPPKQTRSLTRILAMALGLLLAVPVAIRAVFAHAAVPQASRNVAEQQHAIGDFVQFLAPRDPVAVNDVGAIAYVGEARVLDLLGLADLRVARARGMRIDGPLSREQVAQFTEADHVSLAVLYEPWFVGAIPAGWTPLERWRIRDNRVCAFDTVTFFATRPDVAGELRSALEAYRKRLPPRVDVLPIRF